MSIDSTTTKTDSNKNPQNTTTHPNIKLDDSRVIASYANFCRVTGTPEEIVIDFGLNTQANPASDIAVVAAERVVMNFYSAKRLLFALQGAIVRHEEAFGVLEIDVQKRIAKK